MTSRDPALSVAAHHSVAASYRKDLAAHRDEFGPHDGAWVAVGTLLEHAAVRVEPERSQLLNDAIEFSREIIGEENLGRLGEREWQDLDRTPIEAVMLLADTVHRASALHTASALLNALLFADSSMTDVPRGRILSQRARVLRKMGKLEEGLAHDREVLRLGRRARSTELRVRASLGYASLGQMRGNYPEMYRHANRARRLAEGAGLRKLTRDANVGLTVALGVARQFDEALIPAWDAYQTSLGDRIDEGEALQNIGQVLFEAGHLAEARAGFAAVVARELPVHILLAALGGLALTSAETDQAETTKWAAAEIERLADSHAPRYSIAIALLESAIALHRIGDREVADRHRAGAIQLGKVHGFHEIVFRAESISARPSADHAPERIVLTGVAAKVATHVAWMEPSRLPNHVAAAFASL